MTAKVAAAFLVLVVGAGCTSNRRSTQRSTTRPVATSPDFVIDMSLADAERAARRFETAHGRHPRTIDCLYNIGREPSCFADSTPGCGVIQIYRRGKRVRARLGRLARNGSYVCLSVDATVGQKPTK